ncbi:Tripartite motif-containing protein 6 [Holothuria leucospilota]|uniref:Tripartite motif-containing protein 6 n=1 Tax=Holothuria leucospilota TaxID=206669 RepID=A0A9Q1BAN6_HOLLE|nr:Tripartite motif-containing protein 6 [Holothuria leucospilota]
MATAGRTSVLDCPICCERYKNPKMISCGYSFCLDPCLFNLMQSSSPSCPLCRNTIQLPSSGKVEDLPTNLALKSMVAECTTNLNASLAVQTSNETNLVNQKRCEVHEEDFVVFCTVCSELFCQNCLHENHDNKDHDTLQVQEAVDRYCDAKQRCKTQVETVKAKIDEVAESVIQQVRKRTAELHCEVDKNSYTQFNQLEDLEAKGEELSLYSDSTLNMCEKLKAELIHRDFTRKRAVDSISKRTTAFLKDMSDLEKKAAMDLESTTFKASQPSTCINLGEVLGCVQGKESRSSLFKLKDLSLKVSQGHKYLGFTFLRADAVVYFNQDGSERNLRATNLTGQSQKSLGEVDVFGKISDLSIYHMNKYTKFLTVSNNKIVLGMLLFDNGSNIRVIGSKTLSNTLLYHISAVTWDERGENCYALLSDGVTIKMFSFSPTTKETFHVKLKKKVTCSNSRGFVVSQFGMVICDEQKKDVSFYENTKSARAACIVTAP